MLKPPANGNRPSAAPTPRLKPRPMLFKFLCAFFILWMIALLAMYFLTVYPSRHPSPAAGPLPPVSPNP
jgi:hypothetical protein